MSSDNVNGSARPTAVDLIEAFQLTRMMRKAFISTVAEGADDPRISASLHMWLSKDLPMVRVLYLISVGYAGTPTFYRASTSSDQWQAEWLGMVEFNQESRVFVLTEQGRAALAQWVEFMEPLREHPTFAELWTRVTAVE